MFQYKFLALCALAFLALGASNVNAKGNVELQDVNIDIRKIDIEQYDGIIDKIIEYLKDFFQQATTNCLKEVAKNCKKIWYNPKKMLKCAKEYFKEHQGECAIPDTLEYETMIMSIYNEDGDIEDVDLDITKIDIEQYDGIIEAIIDYLKDFFQQATVNCLKEVAKNCKKLWYNPKKLVKCAKEYFKEHQGECAIPEDLGYESLIMNIDNDNNELVELSDESIEARNPLLQIAIRLIAQAFKWAAKHCIKEAAGHCKSHWNNPPALIDCARNFLISNKGRCALG